MIKRNVSSVFPKLYLDFLLNSGSGMVLKPVEGNKQPYTVQLNYTPFSSLQWIRHGFVEFNDDLSYFLHYCRCKARSMPKHRKVSPSMYLARVPEFVALTPGTCFLSFGC